MTDVLKEISTFVIVFLLFLFADHVTPDNSTNNLNWTKCTSRDQQSCNCSSHVMTDVIVRCQITNLSYLDTVINSADLVKRLDLSGNRIQRLTTGSFLRFTKMIVLSLASNGIHTISPGAFDALTQLLELDLSDNNIKHWNTSAIDKQLSNLRLLIFEKNKFLNPDHGILSLSRLQVIYLLLTYIHYTAYHIGCYLVRNITILQDNEFNELNPTAKSEISYQTMKTEKPNELLSRLRKNYCTQPKILFRDSSFFNLSGSYGFRFECEFFNGLKEKRLRFKQPTISDGWKFYIDPNNTCWSTIGLIQIMTSSAGILSLVFNMTVVMATLRSRVLRESVAHVLVANIAVGDLLISLYLIILVSTRQSMSEVEFDDLYLPYYCRFVGSLLLIGQFSSSMVSFVMTLERYLAVIYCMRPHIRITMGTCQIAMTTLWGLSISSAVFFMTFKEFSNYISSMCLPLSKVNSIQVLAVFSGIGILLYIISIALYGHMYLDFRRTNHKTVQLQRENRLARKISLIVFTNVFFLILPLVITYMIGVPPLKNYLSVKEKSITWDTMAVTCLGVNSFLNPILFSFRNEKFRTEFRKLLSPCSNSVNIQSDS